MSEKKYQPKTKEELKTFCEENGGCAREGKEVDSFTKEAFHFRRSPCLTEKQNRFAYAIERWAWENDVRDKMGLLVFNRRAENVQASFKRLIERARECGFTEKKQSLEVAKIHREFDLNRNMEPAKGHVDREGDKLWLCYYGKSIHEDEVKFRKVIQLSGPEGMADDKEFVGYLEKKVAEPSFQEKLCDLGQIYELPVSSRELKERESDYIKAGVAVDDALKKVLDGYGAKDKPKVSLKLKKDISRQDNEKGGRGD